MDQLENTEGGLDDTDLPAAKKICLDNNDVSSYRNDSSLSNSTLHLGSLFSPRQSLSSCSINDRDDNSIIVSSPIYRNPFFDENKSNEEVVVSKGFNKSEIYKSDICMVLSNLNKFNESVNTEDCDQNSHLSKSNSSHLSTKAFNIDKSLEFMDESCTESLSDDNGKVKAIPVYVEPLNNLNKSNTEYDENCVNEVSISLTKESDINCSNKLEVTLDYTCKPDLMVEEKSVLCHPIIKSDAMSPSSKLFLDPSLISMSIDESLVNDVNNMSSPTTHIATSSSLLRNPSVGKIMLEDKDSGHIFDNSNSTNLYEVSGSALDYTCSKSVAFDVNQSYTEIPSINVSETSINVDLECSVADKNIDMSASVMVGCDEHRTEDNENTESRNLTSLKEVSLSDTQNPVPDLYDLSDLKNSFISNKTFSADEVNFLKENLLKVMELLRNDNNSFESYKLASENEKRELLEKIRNLESNVIIHEKSTADVFTSKEIDQEQKIDESGDGNITFDEVFKLQKQYNHLLQLVLVTEADWMDNKLLTNILNDLDLAYTDLFIPITEGSKEYVINNKQIYYIMQHLFKEITKINSFKEDCIEILKVFKRDENILHYIKNKFEDDLVDDIKATFVQVLDSNNCLEKENVELKKEVSNKNNEIKILKSTIENLNQRLNDVKESEVPSNLSVKNKSDMMETTQNISNKMTENLIFHDKLDESYANISDMLESLTTLKKTLPLTEEKYNSVVLKCEKNEIELRKLHEMELVYQELLAQHNTLKTEFDSKSSEIERLKLENKNLIDLVEELKNKNLFGDVNDTTNVMFLVDTPQKSFQMEGKTNEMVDSCDEKSKDLSYRNDEIENLEIGFGVTQNNLLGDEKSGMHEDLDCLGDKLFSPKDEISKLKLDLNCLNEKYSEMYSNFDHYKKMYTYTESDCLAWKEEKQSFELLIESLKSQLSTACEESSKLQCINDEISNNLENLVPKLTDLETINRNLENELSNLQIDSNNKINALNNVISELKTKFDSTEELLMKLKVEHGELKVSYDKICEDLESKNAKLLLHADTEVELLNELEVLRQNGILLEQKIVELQENRTNLETQLVSSKDEVSQLQLDLNNLNDKYHNLSSDFDLYKKTYIRTETEYISLKEEKQSLEMEFNSKRESALEELSKLKTYKEEVDNNLKELKNQSEEEKKVYEEVKKSYEDLKIKYEQSITDREKNKIETNNLLAQSTELEGNKGLQSQLRGMCCNSDHNIDTLNNEIHELKIKFDANENLLIEFEKKHNELKISYDKVCQDFASKNTDFFILAGINEELKKELETLSQNDTLLKQNILDLEEERKTLEEQFMLAKDEVSKLQVDLNLLNKKYSDALSNFDIYKQKYIFTEDESSLWKEEKQSLECEVNSLKSELDDNLKALSKLKSEKEEINNNLNKLENLLVEEKQRSRDVKDSCEDIKMKYEESVVEIENKKIEIQNLMTQLKESEIATENLKNELDILHGDTEGKEDLLNNQVSELKVKLDSCEKLLMEQEEKHSELKTVYEKVLEDLESKNAELSTLSDSNETLLKELEVKRQNIIELQEDRNSLETLLFSSKDEIFQLHSDLNSLKEKYSELFADFDNYKQKYSVTEDESIFWKEEKQSLECQLNSLKSELDNTLKESSKLKSDKEEINYNLKKLENQLEEEKKLSKEVKDSYEGLKTKYEESAAEIKNKTIVLQDLQAQLLDLKTANGNLKNKLSNLHDESDHKINVLNNEISELKTKCESTEKVLLEYKQKYSELKISHDKLYEDLECKNAEISSFADNNEKLLREIEQISQNDMFSQQKTVQLQEDHTRLEAQLVSTKDEVSQLKLDLHNLNGKYSELSSEFDIYKKTYTCTGTEYISLKEEKQSLESELNSKLESALEELSRLKTDKEEFNINLKELKNRLEEEKKTSEAVKDSYEELKTKYEDSVAEIKNKVIELKDLKAQLSNLETANISLKNELNNIQIDSDHKINELNNEISELKTKFESTENLFVGLDKKYSELKVSYDKVCYDLESKNAELLLVTNNKVELLKELEKLRQNDIFLEQKLIELQGNRTNLEAQLLSSKEVVSGLQSDLGVLNAKYSDLSTDFDVYKKTYTCTETEYMSLKEEKQSLVCELSSLKSKVENDLEELSMLKSDKEEINNNLKNLENQLDEERQSNRYLIDSYENLKTKYEDSVSEIKNKTVELQNLLNQLSNLEKANENLISQLNVIRSDSENSIDLLNNEVLELKGRCEESTSLLKEVEKKYNELKISYNQVCEDFRSKSTELSLLNDCKEQLEKEIDSLNQINLSLKQNLADFETSVENHKKTACDLNSQLDDANLKIDYIKKIERRIGVLKDQYDIFSSLCTPDNTVCGEQPFSLLAEFINTVETIIKELLFLKEKCSKEEIKLSSSEEEISRLNILLDSLKEELKLSTIESSKLQENYSSLSKQYNGLLDASKDSNIRCNSLLEKLKEVESHNSLCKSKIEDLKSEVTAKDTVIANLSNIKELYESTIKENEVLSSKLMGKCKEYETVLDKLKNYENNYLSLEQKCEKLTNEINDLVNRNATLEKKSNDNLALYMSSKDNIEILLKEKEEIRKNFIKCEKDYQNSLDLVQKYQENMGNLDKQYNLSIAKLNVILKEKENYESQTLCLQKVNDELLNRVKDLNNKFHEKESMLSKLRELEKSYDEVSAKCLSLENQLLDYENLRQDNEILKSRVSERDLLSKNLSQDYNALNEKCNTLSNELKSLSTAVLSLLPGENSAIEVLKVVGEKLISLKKIENELEEEKIKCKNLDEECDVLNEDLKFKDVVIGDMYKDHSSQMNELKELLKKEENLRQEIMLENSTLKDKIKCLDSEVNKLKTVEQSVCASCTELKGVLQKLKVDLVDNSSKVTTLQLQIEENEITNKKKIHDYRKKISSLQEELGAALNKLEDNRLKNEVSVINAYAQTEDPPVQISGQCGIVQSFKIKEQEEKIHKYEKENLLLKRLCQSRLQTVQELKTKIDNISKHQKTQRNVLEEVQNQQSS